MFVAVSSFIVGVFKRSGVMDQLGEENIYPETDEAFGALDHALADAEAWIGARWSEQADGSSMVTSTHSQ
jgi:hypothetical protein